MGLLRCRGGVLVHITCVLRSVPCNEMDVSRGAGLNAVTSADD